MIAQTVRAIYPSRDSPPPTNTIFFFTTHSIFPLPFDHHFPISGFIIFSPEVATAIRAFRGRGEKRTATAGQLCYNRGSVVLKRSERGGFPYDFITVALALAICIFHRELPQRGPTPQSWIVRARRKREGKRGSVSAKKRERERASIAAGCSNVGGRHASRVETVYPRGNRGVVAPPWGTRWPGMMFERIWISGNEASCPRGVSAAACETGDEEEKNKG